MACWDMHNGPLDIQHVSRPRGQIILSFKQSRFDDVTHFYVINMQILSGHLFIAVKTAKTVEILIWLQVSAWNTLWLLTNFSIISMTCCTSESYETAFCENWKRIGPHFDTVRHLTYKGPLDKYHRRALVVKCSLVLRHFQMLSYKWVKH